MEQKLDLLQNTEWHQIALELQKEDPYQFLRAYSPGVLSVAFYAVLLICYAGNYIHFKVKIKYIVL